MLIISGAALAGRGDNDARDSIFVFLFFFSFSFWIWAWLEMVRWYCCAFLTVWERESRLFFFLTFLLLNSQSPQPVSTYIPPTVNTHPTLSSLIIQPRPKVSIASLTRVLLLAVFLSVTSISSSFTSIAVGTPRIAIRFKPFRKDYLDLYPKSYPRIQTAPNLFAPNSIAQLSLSSNLPNPAGRTSPSASRPNETGIGRIKDSTKSSPLALPHGPFEQNRVWQAFHFL